MSEKIFSEELEKARDNNRIVSVYCDRNRPGYYLVGYVECVTDDFYCLRCVVPHGYSDGFTVRPLNSVVRVDSGNRYLEKLELLYQARKEKHRPDFLSDAAPSDNLFVRALEKAQDMNLVVSLEIDGDGASDVVGYVAHLGHDYVRLDLYSHLGDNEGDMVCQLDDITFIDCDDQNAQDLDFMRNWHQINPPF